MNIVQSLLMIGNICLIMFSLFLLLMVAPSPSSPTSTTEIICYLAFMVLGLLNIFYIKSTYSERKKLEEEIKTQEAKNRLKALQKEEKEEGNNEKT